MPSLLVLTRRDACRRALVKATSALSRGHQGEPQLVFVKSFADAQQALLDLHAWAVDLGSVKGSTEEIVASIRRLVSARPWLNTILVVPHLNPELETGVIFGVRDLPCVGLMPWRDLQDAKRWTALLADLFVDRHALMIEADLRDACPARRANVMDDYQIRQLLRLGARLGRVGDVAAASGKDRVDMWRRFKQRWGRSPSEMLALFRVLWAAHLKHEGYTSADIARLLGFRDTYHYARRLGARVRLPKSLLNTLDYSDVVARVATSLVSRAPLHVLAPRAAAALRRSARVTMLVVAALGGVGGVYERDLRVAVFGLAGAG